MLFQVARVNPFFDESKKVMVRPVTDLYHRRIDLLCKRIRHPTKRRLIRRLEAEKKSYAGILGILSWLDALFGECEKARNHGAVTIEKAKSFLSRTTYKRYVDILLRQTDDYGKPDFHLDEHFIHILNLRPSAQAKRAAEARWEAKRLYERDRKRAYRAAQSGQAAPSTSPQKVPSEAFCDLSPRSLYESKDQDQDKDSAGAKLDAMAERLERLEQEAVGSNEPQGQEVELAPMTSAEITEAAYREIEAERERVPARTLVAVPPLRGQLTAWGYRADLAARHRFTDNELALAVEKVERARTPLGNRAGAVVATILKWRRGDWMIGAAA